MTARYRTLRSTMQVTSADHEANWKTEDREVLLVQDCHAEAVGIMILGDSELRGTVILIPEVSLRALREFGKAADTLEIEE